MGTEPVALLTPYASNTIPVNIYLFKVTIETLEKGINYV